MEKEIIKKLKEEGSVEAIKTLMDFNGGYITSKQVTELGIHRMYLNIMMKKGIIQKVKKGIYIDNNIIEDIYYSFQLKYPKIIYSRFTALYFYGLTEIFPHTFELTVDYNYHVDEIDKSCSVIKCKKQILELGVVKVKTQGGHYINCYDRERCICDIIKYKNRLDIEQVKKSVKMYVKDDNKNLSKLSKYAKIMNIYDDVMNFVGMYYE